MFVGKRLLELLWGKSGVLFIEAEKIGVIVEARRVAGIGNGTSLADLVVDKMDAPYRQIIVDRESDVLVEEMADVILAVIKDA